MTDVTTPAVTNLLISSVSKQRHDADGNPTYDIDNEMLQYRLFDVDTDNFAAFIRATHNCIDLILSLSDKMPPALWKSMYEEIRNMIRTDIMSVTAKSGEQGKLMKLLLKDESSTFHYLQSDQRSKNMAEKLKSFQGGGQQQQQQQPQAGR